MLAPPIVPMEMLASMLNTFALDESNSIGKTAVGAVRDAGVEVVKMLFRALAHDEVFARANVTGATQRLVSPTHIHDEAYMKCVLTTL